MKKTICDSWLPLLLVTVLTSSACSETSDAPTASTAPAAIAERADADAVTEQNLLASERYWPYRVALREPLHVDGRDAPLPAGFTGVLIRVEASGMPRVDFGSHGKYEIRAGATDIVERANAIRRGESPKAQPNFVQAIEARMLDSAADSLQALPIETSRGRSGFLCIFADPQAEDFGTLVRELAPLRERAGVMTIFFPQGEHADAAVRERLRALEWPVPFLFDHLSEPYSRTFGVEETALPFVLLQTPEGRVLYQGRLADVPALLAAFDSAFDGATRTSPLPESGS